MRAKIVAVVLACLGQLLTLAAMAMIARHYTAPQLAEYGVFVFMFSVLQILVTLRLEQGLVYQCSSKESSELASAALLILIPTVFVGGACASAYFYWNTQTSSRAAILSGILSASLLFGSVAKVLVQLLASQDRFYSLALANVSRPALIALTQICFLGATAGYFQLPIAFALSQLLLATVVYGIIATTGRPKLIHTLERSKAAFVKNKAFVYYNLPQNAVFVISDAMLPLSLPWLFPGSDAVALFWLASRTVMTPATVLAESLRAIIYRTVAQMKKETILRYIITTSAVLAVVTIAPVLVLLVAGDFLFSAVYGASWGSANNYAIILGCLVVANTAALPFVAALPVLGLQGHYFGLECVGFAVRAILLYGVPWSTPLQATLYCTGAYILVVASFLVILVCRLREKELVR